MHNLPSVARGFSRKDCDVKSFGRGTDWALRWSAKPVVTGSIPATASIFRPLYGRKLWGSAHRFQLGQAFSEWLSRGKPASPFWQGVAFGMTKSAKERRTQRQSCMTCPAELLMQKHKELIAVSTERSNLKEKLIAAQKELSSIKRAPKGT
jgi:hypothetical protein